MRNGDRLEDEYLEQCQTRGLAKGTLKGRRRELELNMDHRVPRRLSAQVLQSLWQQAAAGAAHQRLPTPLNGRGTRKRGGDWFRLGEGME